MKLTGFIVVLAAALAFLIPTMRNEHHAFERQAQEEAPIEEVLQEKNTFRIVFEVKTPEEETIADIMWMKKAAEVAINEGVPHFNVLEQTVTTRPDTDSGEEFSVVDGVIELDQDPMRAEFDAREIQSLVLTDDL